MSLASVQAVTVTSGPSFLSAVWANRLKYIKVACVGGVDRGKRDDFGQGVRICTVGELEQHRAGG